MNARIVFLFGLVFTVMNIVMAFTTHSGLLIMAILGLIITLGSATFIWGTPASAMTEEELAEFDRGARRQRQSEDFLLADERAYGYTGANDDN